MSSTERWEYNEAFEEYCSTLYEVEYHKLNLQSFSFLLNMIRKSAFVAGIEYGKTLTKEGTD